MDSQGRYSSEHPASQPLQPLNEPASSKQTRRLEPTAPLSSPLPAHQQSPRNPRFARTRRWLRSRTGRVVSLCLVFLLGLLLGAVGIVVLAFSFSADNAAVANPPVSGSSAIVVQIGQAYITHLVSNALQSSGLPGTVQNVQVTPANGDQLTITGDDVIGVLGVGISHRFTIVLQPYVSACQIKVHVLHADLGGLTVTQFATVFEGQINQQIQVNTSKLPKGFTYCTTSVRTDTSNVYVTYAATPLQS